MHYFGSKKKVKNMFLKTDIHCLKQQKFFFQIKSYVKTQFMEPIKG